MRSFWVKFSHLLKCCERVIFLISNTTVKQHGEGLVVGMYIWRKQKRRPRITVSVVSRTVVDRPSSVSFCKLWQIYFELLKIWIHPTEKRIGNERHSDDVHDFRFVGQ